MKRLLLLIACLLLSYNTFSQTATQIKNKVIILTEKEARLAAIELVKYDSCNLVVKEQESRIENFKKITDKLEYQVSIKDSIILQQSKFIDTQNKLLDKPKKIEIHSYFGIRTNELRQAQPSVFTNVLAEYQKWSLGATYLIRTDARHTWGILLQYKLF
jgi:hypothetical protein